MNSNPFYKDPLKPTPGRRFVNGLQFLAGFGLLLLISWFTILGQNQVDGPSMRPNYYTGEFLLLNRIPQLMGHNLATTLGLEYKTGEVIVFTKPGFPDLLKRVIAVPGDRIALKNGKYFVNGQVLQEEYIPEKLYTNAGTFLQENAEEMIVPEGHVFTSGDNRPESTDSRAVDIGFVKREWIKGKVILRIWPFDRFSFIPLGETTLVNESDFDFSKADPSFRNNPTPE